jgi:hypothetical protein
MYTCAKGIPAGEVSVKVTVCPGLTIVPDAGEVIWNSGEFCANVCRVVEANKLMNIIARITALQQSRFNPVFFI